MFLKNPKESKSLTHQFAELQAGTEELLYKDDNRAAKMYADELTAADKANIVACFHAVCEFINENSLFSGGVSVPTNLFQASAGCEGLNPSINIGSSIGANKILDLVTSVGIPEKHHQAATMSLINLMLKMNSANENMNLYRENHFTNVSETVEGRSLRLTPVSEFLPRSLHGEFAQPVPGTEAFGAEIDRVIPDIRVAFTVTLLKFHRSLADRIMHRRVHPTTIVKYVIPYAEVYDLMKSMDKKADVRNSSDHRVPFINLYADPRIVANKLKKIVPLKANDTNNAVLRDGILVPNVKANLFDLSMVANAIGYNHTDYWDLIADGVILDSVILEVKDDSHTEEFTLSTRSFARARLQQVPNPLDSGDRATIFDQTFKFHKDRTTTSGGATQIFTGINADNCVEISVSIAPQVNLKWHTVNATAAVTAKSYVQVPGTPVAGPVTTLLGNLKVAIVGYVLDARYSEENLRKTSVAIRSHYRTMDFEIPVGRNYVLDYALNESLPEFIMSHITEAINTGQDYRMIEMIMNTLMDVYDITKEENADPNFRESLYKIGFNYVASQRVRPTVYLGAIDVSNVDTIRSSDILGDIRQYVELQLVNIFSLLHQNSFYKTQLNDGEKPHYKVITSNIIMENLLNVPHIHNHMQNAANDTTSGSTEFTRVLPNGVVLDCVTTCFNFLRDKMIIIPYRPGDPESELNIGHNWDYGTYVAHYTPQIANGVAKRVFANAREMPIITNPIGILLEVQNISTIIDLFQLADVKDPVNPDIPQFTSKIPNTSTLKGPKSRIGA